MKPIFFFISASLLLGACTNQPEHKSGQTGTETDTVSSAVPAPGTLRSREPLLFDADSVQAIYYDNPDGDTLRYARFFTYSTITDTAQIGALQQELAAPHSLETAARGCRSEGKLYFYKGEQVRTLYFSGRAEPCSYFYLIRDGQFYYLPFSDRSKALLQEWKKGARKP